MFKTGMWFSIPEPYMYFFFLINTWEQVSDFFLMNFLYLTSGEDIWRYLIYKSFSLEFTALQKKNISPTFFKKNNTFSRWNSQNQSLQPTPLESWSIAVFWAQGLGSSIYKKFYNKLFHVEAVKYKLNLAMPHM